MTEPSGLQSSVDSPGRPQALLIASTLCWVWGILIVLIGISVLIPAIAMRGLSSRSAIFALGLCLFGLGYCSAGYLVRKMRLIGGWIALVAAVLFCPAQFVGGTAQAVVGLVVNLAIVVLVMANWRRLRPSQSEVGA